MTRPGEKALIKVGYGCNEHCAFCHTAEIRHIEGEVAEVDAKIHRAAALRHSMIVLSGGEPTIRPELLHWAQLSARLGLDFGLVTNGLRLAYAALVKRLVALRLRYVYLSLHGGSATIHDRMVRTEGAFGPAMEAVANLAAHPGLDLTINCVVTRGNLEHLTELVDALRPYPQWTLKFSMVEPKGGGQRLPQIVPRVEHVAQRIAAAIEYGHANNPGQPMRHGGVPLCLLPGLEDHYDDLRTHGFRTMVEIGEPDLFPVDDDNKVQPAACTDCSLRGGCPGLFLGYHERHGDAMLRPDRGRPRANAFNYALQRTWTPPPPPARASDDDHCPLRDDGPSPWDRGRDLWIRHHGRLALYRADTRDFSDAQLRATKFDHGQVYLDASRKDAPTDFARDLVPLARAALCDHCPHEPDCTGLWEPAFEDRFSHDDAAVVRVLAGLRGRVLDLGCGEAPYLHALRAAAEDGALHYTGIDPDPAAIEALRARAGWGRFETATAAEFAERAHDEPPVDHLLVLRSWNHLPDPIATLTALRHRLRPGGSILIVDNIAFGLARGRAHTERAERSTARHEHYRNDGLADAARALQAVPGLVTHPLAQHPVGPGGSNQWWLHLRIEAVGETASPAAFAPGA